MTLHAEPPVTEPVLDAGASAGDQRRRRGLSWPHKAALVLLSAGMLSLSFAPLGQFYLAWVGLAPLLLVIADAGSIRGAFFWGWLGGTVFFLINLSFLLLVTVPGALLLPPYLALYWGLAAAAMRGARLVGGDVTRSDGPMSGFSTSASAGSSLSVFFCATGIAAIWVAAEWLRGTVFTGFPWLFVGYSQSPMLAVCQIADFASVYGVSFVVVLVNVLVAMTWLHRTDGRRRLLAPWVAAAAVLIATAGYGGWRLAQTAPLMPGPTVLVVQPNDRDFRNKAAVEKQRESVQFHLEQTAASARCV
jgi:apolipoprotein N-acyltransferase